MTGKCLAFLVSAAVGFAQPRFDVASVRAAEPGAQTASMNGGPMPAGPFNQSGGEPGRITWKNVRLLRVIQVAYDFPVDRIDAPDWVGQQGYDITATMPMGTSVADFRLMLQELLKERFKLAAHKGTKQVSGYALEIAKGGPKIPMSKGAAASPIADDDRQKPSPRREAALQYMATRTEAFRAMVTIDENGFGAPKPGNPYYGNKAPFEVTIAVNGWFRSTKLNATMPEIATFLGGLAGGPAEDATGLAGKYDVHVEYVPRPSASGAVATTEPGPDILDAVQQQLGLKLTPKKVPVEALVIDHAERIPAGN